MEIVLWFLASPILLVAWFIIACVALALFLAVFFACGDAVYASVNAYHRWLIKRNLRRQQRIRNDDVS